MASREVNEKLEGFYEKARQNPKTWIGLGILLAVILLIWLPPWRVSHFGINNATVEADLENQYRVTLAQILGGIAIGITLYYTWRRISIAEQELKTTQEGQITERFTRAVEQLGAVDQSGNPALEIRLGGIYALERIANESDKDYWPIMEILTAYVRKNTSVDELSYKNSRIASFISMDIQANESTKKEAPKIKEISLDIQAILNVIGRRKHSYQDENDRLDLQRTNLQGAELSWNHFERVQLDGAHLEGARLLGTSLQGSRLLLTHLEGVNLLGAHLEGANLLFTHLEGAYLQHAHLEGADLTESHLEEAYLQRSYLEGANFESVNLNGANFTEANLKGAKNLTVDQLSKVKTLYKAELDPELEKPLREKYPALFEKPYE